MVLCGAFLANNMCVCVRVRADPSSMAGQAAALMNPEVIQRMREMQQTIRKKYM
jgi:hypothetical protein